jgi:hypothetical protein
VGRVDGHHLGNDGFQPAEVATVLAYTAQPNH